MKAHRKRTRVAGRKATCRHVAALSHHHHELSHASLISPDSLHAKCDRQAIFNTVGLPTPPLWFLIPQRIHYLAPSLLHCHYCNRFVDTKFDQNPIHSISLHYPLQNSLVITTVTKFRRYHIRPEANRDISLPTTNASTISAKPDS